MGRKGPKGKAPHPGSEDAAVRQYLPFVHKVARSLAKWSTKLGVTEADLVQEGLIAVLVSYRAWKPEGGANMLTFIHRPVYWAMHRAIRRATQSNRKGARPHLFPYEDDAYDAQTPDDARISMQWEELLRRVVDAQRDSEARDVLAYDRLPRAVSDLEERQRAVIRMRFVQGMTLAAIGEFYNLTRERVRQIECEALDNLRRAISGGKHGAD